MSKRKKKEKVTYIDDGHTIADMSNVGTPRVNGRKGTLKEQWNTYWSAVKMMFVPMLVALGIISVAFLVMLLSLK